MRRKLMIANIATILVSVFLIIIVCLVTFLGFFGIFGVTMKDIVERNGTTNNIQVLAVHYIDEYCEASNDKERANAIEALGKATLNYGYRSALTVDDRQLYSDFTYNEKELFSANSHMRQNNLAIFENDQIAMMHLVVTAYGKTFIFEAVNPNLSALSAASTGVPSEDVSRYIEIYLIIILCSALFIILLANLMISGRTSKTILKPLRLLRTGAREIKNGNLDFEVKYESKGDEFEQVCADFDEMRLRLKDSVQAQIAAEQGRRELLAGISHDLRTPLTAIKGYVEGLRDGVANTPEKREKYLGTIFQKACDMDTLVDKLFLFSRLDSGRFPFNFEQTNLKRYADRFFTRCVEEFALRGLHISYHCALDGSETVRMDLQEMDRVLSNILDNSAKYMPRATGNADIRVCTQGNYGVIELRDDGDGVEAADLPAIFEDFFRADRARKDPGSGSGLGLAIARHIIHAHSGSITARNQNGLIITIRLPLIINGEEKDVNA